MPFDNPRDPVVANLLRAKAAIADPAKHCIGRFETGDRMCAAMALARATGQDQELRAWGDQSDSVFGPEFRALRSAAAQLVNGNPESLRAVCLVNNTLPHSQVLAMFDRAAEIHRAAHV